MATTDTSTANCAACGKEGGNLNTCNKCKIAKYCNAACKKKHRSKHKKDCEKRVAELHDEALFRDHPPTDDCPICFLPLPLDAHQSTFKPCCGKLICSGCIYAMLLEEARGRGKGLCAFCRKPYLTYEEGIKQVKKLKEADNAYAFYTHGGYYAHADMGLPQDYEKANELWLRAGELGCAQAYSNLGNSYYDSGKGVEVDRKKAKHYWELAAMKGDVNARHNLGCLEEDAGDDCRAYKHFILSARAGYNKSLNVIKDGFMKGIITKDEYANTLRAHQKRHDEMKSDDRGKAEVLRLIHNIIKYEP